MIGRLTLAVIDTVCIVPLSFYLSYRNAAPARDISAVDISIKLAISTGIGLLVGLEREWSQKELGSRTFTITAILGMLSALANSEVTALSFAGILLVVLIAALHNLRASKPAETTTSAALILTYVLGLLVGQGHHYTPVAVAIVMTFLLAAKHKLSHFAGGLTESEVRSAVLLGLLGFVIYPILPDGPVDPWQLVNPREAWLTVILIAVLGFVNYVLLKVYHARGLYYAAILGGMVNSTATIAGAGWIPEEPRRRRQSDSFRDQPVDRAGHVHS